jgi:alpha-L-fucosidase
MMFEPNLESLAQHQVPDWFHDSKLGIFIHWGLFSVPGWAPLAGDISQSNKELGWKHWFENNSYAEWYLNSLKFENGPTRKFHSETYGPDFAYDDFAPQFNEAVQAWNPDEWADLFQKIGARYVVLTTKHHDGFNLWPTNHPCPRKPGYQASRDLVGELTDAVRAQGLRMGLYYSGGLDWSFNEARIEDIRDVWGTIVQEPEFVEYSVNHWRELIDRYHPALMWNDIGYPVAADLPELFAYYYNNVPDGVINDRFRQGGADAVQPGSLPRGPHYDFITPEYTSFDQIQDLKWESCRGIGHSFGYNRAEGDDQLLSLTALIHLFVDIVSKNGNLLLNIGPMADGTIPQNQRERLESFGAWLDVNGEAIFGTRPWVKAESQTTDGLGVRFTRQGEAVYASILGTPVSRKISITGLHADISTSVQLLGSAGVLHWQQEGDNLTITLPDELPDAPAHCLKLLGVSG